MKHTEHILRGIVSVILAGSVFTASAATNGNFDDDDIADALELELLLDDKLSFNNIDVRVIDGIATLEGEARHLLAKERAARIAEMVKGVRSVVNLVKVRPLTPVTAAQLQNDVESALYSDPATESYEIEVAADSGGNVTLAGEVESWQEKNLAAKVAKSVRGVTGVDNDITVDYEEDRPDIEIKEDVESRLAWSTLIDDGLIDVAVENGEVKLSGTVGSATEKRRARYAAWGITGVTAVDESGLEVERWARDKDLRKDKYVMKSDEEIRKAVMDALLWDPRVYSFKIEPDVRNGKVTLRGTVDNLKAKRAAERVARHTVGVNRVVNFIKIRSKEWPSDDEIRSSILDQLALDPVVESFEINVAVNNRIVTLRGGVDTMAEKLQAEDVASGVKGVVHVQNFLTTTGGGLLETDDYLDYDPYDWDYTWSYYPHYEPAIPSEVATDAGIKEDIEDQLFWSPFVDSDDVNVSVEDGVATLTGQVETRKERVAAHENALEGGARKVNNLLTIGGE